MEKMKIAIVTTSVREGRVAPGVAQWVKNFADEQAIENASFEIVDLANYKLPLLGVQAPEEQYQDAAKWQADMAKFDAYIFVVAEYNHSVTGALKNATDFLKTEMVNKPAAFVGYGGLGGIRAIEGLRTILAELQVATVQKTVNFLLAVDFENYTVFKPQAHHEQSASLLLKQLLAWAKALKTIR